MNVPEDDVVARLRAGEPGYPETGPDAGLTLASARRALRRSRVRRALAGGVAVVIAALVGLTTVGGLNLPGTLAAPFGYDIGSLPDEGDPPIYPADRMLDDASSLGLVLSATNDLGLTLYIDDPGAWGRPGCRVFTWSQGAYRDRHSDCANATDPELPFDAASEAAFGRVTKAIERSGVNVDRIDKGGWGAGTSFHLRDNSWRWNWYYSYVPDTPHDTPVEKRTQTNLGTRLEVHIIGDWWFVVEPDD
ncbi:hypothetical protein Ais01nite_18970 [Asanoa ishikariensis]|uniref:Uncharacterized protein n=1 Tax=Asanoa ishikariensis TaxID=137265 RepID=A0A1H3UCE3_9ACTN|nr:hypothetical protein [Asanoa ishikariensis]GIF63862.1 hypothetical protein Ais01nite_18970 [Asanoa ishikariensis]SDZ60048.1 hypothetical protein SAMN05421684_6977 [Asanoa ishikariensis]